MKLNITLFHHRYTGVYTHGGPDTKSLIAHNDISTLTDRSAADVRGVKR